MRPINSEKILNVFFAVISLKIMIFRSVKRTLLEAAVSTSKLSNLLMALHHYGKIGKNVPYFSDCLLLKIKIHISYKYKQIKVPNLVYFGSPSIASYNDYSTISIYLQI